MNDVSVANTKNAIPVVAGRGRTRVGTIQVREGLNTTLGKINKVTPSGTAYIDGVQYRNPSAKLTILLSEAKKFGYPHSEGCVQEAVPGATVSASGV